MMWQFLDNPRTPISEVEAFCGFVLNNRGSQTRRQLDSSIKLREEMGRVSTSIVNEIRERGESASQEDVVELCLACAQVGCIKDTTGTVLPHGNGDMRSFRVLAACSLIREVNALMRRAEDDHSGGGFVRVSGGGQQQRHMTLALR
jgi:hypothetical protein